MDIPSIEEVRERAEAYLSGSVDLDDFSDWINDLDKIFTNEWFQEHRNDPPTGSSQINGIAVPCHELSFPDGSVQEMVSQIELMDTEMFCSGSFRTEAMFRADLRSLLDGQPMTAFSLDWDAYVRWCEQREKDILRLMRAPWWQRGLNKIKHLKA